MLPPTVSDDPGSVARVHTLIMYSCEYVYTVSKCSMMCRRPTTINKTGNGE